MSEHRRQPNILIIEDGDEYLDNLSRFVPGPVYCQSKSGNEAIRILGKKTVHLIYLDMRFDRIPPENLVGDHAAITKKENNDENRAWRYMQNNQGLFILDALKKADCLEIPVILAYDFSQETQRFEHLKRIYPLLHWIPDAVTPDQIQALFDDLI